MQLEVSGEALMDGYS